MDNTLLIALLSALVGLLFAIYHVLCDIRKALAPPAEERSTVTHNVAFTASGPQLVKALAIETDRMGRVKGR